MEEDQRTKMMEAMFGIAVPPKADVLPEAAVARLTEALPRFNGPNEWVEGDLVTIRADAPLSGQGSPHVVVRSGDVNLATSVPPATSWADGVCFDVQVAVLREGCIMPFLAPHWALERWELPAPPKAEEPVKKPTVDLYSPWKN